ncbi:uncharacterized protein LOC109504591 [Harpegnathos saltator]|uniref:uncharacterized protein LOC109504591 n=1 Tax=Harpegnathos saltator TaxID=610380 RepID=UPI000DBEDBE3|nr:uncharacterized protein LOC109504591 [Harpegnathos saltator]
MVVEVYLPHRHNRIGLGKLAHIKGILDRVGDVARQCYPRPIVLAEDSNAHSTEWGCDPRQEDSRGEALIDWAAGLDLLLMNRGLTGTYVRPNGESVIDLTCWTAALGRETFPSPEGRPSVNWMRTGSRRPPLWPPGTSTHQRRAVYWWTAALSDLREAAVQARRDYFRARRRDREAAREKEGYLEATKAFKAAIVEVKKGAWEKMVNFLDEDPWGRPYKRTIGKIRPWALDPQALEGLLATLFPKVEGGPPRSLLLRFRRPGGLSGGVHHGQEETRGQRQSAWPP